MSHRLPVADIQFISDFAAFCRTKGDEGYNCGDVRQCALAQFGFPNVVALECVEHGIPSEAYRVAANPGFEPQTFSALAARLEALIADAPEVERV